LDRFETGCFCAYIAKVIEEITSGGYAGAMSLGLLRSNLSYDSWVGYFSSLWNLVFLNEKHGVGSGDPPSDALG
jgi:hypothetical protein